jgi:glycosyltransferase involved in cell wall biosynthesis
LSALGGLDLLVQEKTTMREPKVSVCMPCYNRQDYVGGAIESVLAQSFSDFELLIADNCSEDGTPRIVQKYADKDERITFVRNPQNIGICSSLNSLLLNARGQYIKFCFSDDILAPECLSVFVSIMDKYPNVSLITSFSKFIGDSSDIRGESFFPGVGLLNGKKYQKDLLINGNWVGNMSCVMIRRKDLHIGLFSHILRSWSGDHDMWIRLLGIGDAYVVSEILSFIRIHKGQESSIHAVDFRLIKERLMLANTAFQFPYIYGDYTKAEQKRMHRHLLKRLVREGLGRKGLKPKLNMIKIGLSRQSCNRLVFFLTLIENLPRIFRKSRFSE